MPGLRITFKPCRPFFNTWSHVLFWSEPRLRGSTTGETEPTKTTVSQEWVRFSGFGEPKHGCIMANAEQCASHCFGEVGLREPGALPALVQATATTALLIRARRELGC